MNTITLNVTTDQEAFDAVVAHLRTTPGRAVDEHGNCKYRTTDGRKCAVGALINDDVYDPYIDSRPNWYNSLSHLIDEEAVDVGSLNRHLLATLQAAHDNHCNWEGDEFHNWEALAEAAESYRLNAEALEGLL